jgi:hypothetical protein
MRCLYGLFTTGVIICLGCGGASTQQARYPNAKKAVEEIEPKAEDGAQAPAGGEKKAVEETPRKIIYTAQIELIADDFDKVSQELDQLVKDHGAYIAKSDIHGSPGVPRSGTWTIRVPVKHFEDFNKALAKLGELRQDKTDSDDITDRYYDLKAHIKNDQVEEEALQKLLIEKSATGKLEDLLAIRRELREIRGKIEEQQGRLQRWDKETALSTVTLKITDRRDYVAPTTPHFGTTIAHTFEGSLGALTSFGQGIVLVMVALVPWLPVIAVIVVPIWLAIRRMRKQGHENVATAIPAGPSPGE